MTENPPTAREHLIALGSYCTIVALGAVVGAFLATRFLIALTQLVWTPSPVPHATSTWVFAAGVLLRVLVGIYLGAYVWLRLAKGRLPKQVVYRRLVASADIPVLSNLQRRMFEAAYGREGDGAA